MPGGGFVMSFTDITAFREAEQALKEANESLEHRVSNVLTNSHSLTLHSVMPSTLLKVLTNRKHAF